MLKISNLCLGLTRRCQLNCAHCLRGPSQQFDMSIKILDSLFEQGLCIGTLWLSGGEPTLVPKLIRRIGDHLRMKNSYVEMVGLVTNGLKVRNALKAIDYVDTYVCDSSECMILVSADRYHLQRYTLSEDYEYLVSHPWFKGEKGVQPGREMVVGNWDINTGGYGESEEHIPDIEKFRSGQCYNCRGGAELYVTAKGVITTSANMSYAQEDDVRYSLGYVSSLSDLITGIVCKAAKHGNG